MFNPEAADFVDVLSNGNENARIASCGDTYDILNNIVLRKLDQDNVAMVICVHSTEEVVVGQGIQGALLQYSNDVVFAD